MKRACMLIALLAGCGASTRPCKSGTLFLTVRLDSASAAATTLALEIAGSTTRHGSLSHSPGVTGGTVEIDFSGAYPSGETATVIVTALSGSVQLGVGSTPIVFSGSCQSATVDVSGTTGDLGRDVAIADLPIDDLPAQPDAQPVDAFDDAAVADATVDSAEAGCSTANCGGTCVDGVCCDTPCTGQCEACDLPGSAGICTPVSGAPHGERAACVDGVAACAGACDGSNRAACSYPTVNCSPQGCLNGNTVSLPSECQNGLCVVPSPSTHSCTGTCSAGLCGDCAKDSDCGAGNFCDDTGSCSPQLTTGAAATCNNLHCIDPNHCGECASGNCVNGACCTTPCAGLCNDCTSNRGTCAVRTGAPLSTRGSCANTLCLACNGSDGQACHDPTPEPSCAPARCSGTSLVTTSMCSGGSCVAPAPTSCGLYSCSSAACETSCSSDGDCAANAWCSGTSCIAKKANGIACSAADQCANGNCVAGSGGSFCCDSACTGTCQVCDGTGPSPKGTCGFAHDNTQCASDAHCSGTSLVMASQCLSGTCTAQSPSSCGLYACSSAACNLSCGNDGDCAGNAFCSGTSCVAKKANGLACTAANQCANGNCVAGSGGSVCCDSSCTGTCRVCDGTGPSPKGTCGFSHDNTQCASDAHCSGTSLVMASQCIGGACTAQSPSSCGLYSCSAAACETSCGSDGDCVNAFCSGTSCVAKKANGVACTAADQCSNGNCVAGSGGSVCCDTSCTGACQVCDGTGASAKGTCGAAADGIQCASDAHCSGSSLVASSQCMSGSCTAQAPVSCGLYNCSPSPAPVCLMAGGCVTDADCVNAYCAFGSCLAKKANGAVCIGTDQCTSGNCVPSTNGSGSVCCDTACAGGVSSCQVCDGTGPSVLGTCGPAHVNVQCGTDCSPSEARFCDGTHQYCPVHGVCKGVCCSQTYKPGAPVLCTGTGNTCPP